MSETLHIEQMELLLQKSGDYLENFGFGGDLRPFIDYDRSNQSFLLELIIKYCTKIKYFELTEFNNESIYKAFHLIENIKQSLNYLTIKINDIKLSSIVLHNLGQILPLRLDYLCLNLIFNKEDFEIFLKNSQNTFINKLLINYYMQEEGYSTLPSIKEYIMKKKRVKYLATLENTDLFFCKYEVKEFELHNIKIRKFSELQINYYDLYGAHGLKPPFLLM